MGLDKAEKTAIIEGYATHESDTGSTEVQVAVLTERIKVLTDHPCSFRAVVVPTISLLR